MPTYFATVDLRIDEHGLAIAGKDEPCAFPQTEIEIDIDDLVSEADGECSFTAGEIRIGKQAITGNLYEVIRLHVVQQWRFIEWVFERASEALDAAREDNKKWLEDFS